MPAWQIGRLRVAWERPSDSMHAALRAALRQQAWAAWRREVLPFRGVVASLFLLGVIGGMALRGWGW